MADRRGLREAPAPKELVTFRSLGGGTQWMSVVDSVRCWSHFHTRFAFAFAKRGFGDWMYRGWAPTITPGTTLMIEPDELHVTRALSGPVDFDVLFIEPETLRTLFELPEVPHFTVPQSGDPLVAQRLRRFHGLVADGADEGEVQDELHRLVLALLPAATGVAHCEPPVDQALFRKACRAITERFHDEPTAGIDGEWLAKRIGYSHCWLVRTFGAALGITPYQYFMRVRVEHARELVLRGPTADLQTFADVAAACGYSDLPHMTRAFRSLLATTPLDLVRQTNVALAWKRSVGDRRLRPRSEGASAR